MEFKATNGGLTSDDKANSILYTIVAFHGVTLAIGCFIAFETRKVDIAEFKEGPHIAIAVYTAAFIAALGIPALFSIPYYVSQIALLCALFVCVGVATICVIFVPKYWAIFTDWEGSHKTPWFMDSTTKSSGSIGAP